MDGDNACIVKDWANPGDFPGQLEEPRPEWSQNVERWNANVAANWPRVEHTIASLRDTHVRTPAYIVATGPSLERNWQDLYRVKEGIVIGVNGTAVMPGVSHALTHYVAMDGGPLPSEWARALAGRNGNLKALFSVQVDKEFAAPFDKPYWWRPDMDGLCPMPDMPDAQIDTHRTTTQAAVHLAWHMGCDPIVLVGQDCAFTDVKRHAWEYLTEEDVPRFPTEYGKLMLIPGVGDRLYVTCRLFVEYKWAFEAIATMMAANGRRLINCTEGGVLDEGIECRRLQEVIFEENGRRHG
jgi:hypothetical protein